MQEWIGGIVAAFGLGLLTSISPCPLTINIAAISYIGRRVGSARQVFLAGVLYTVGQTAAYVGLAVALLVLSMSIPRVTLFLNTYLHRLLGPILIVVGMCLLGLISFPTGGRGISENFQKRIDALGLGGALLLGLLFALSFCPTSAGLFFGSLIPLALEAQSSVAVPVAYGVGTALPVMLFATLIAAGTESLGKTFNVLTKIEWWARHLAGGILILLGMYFTLKYIFEVL